MAGFDIKEMTFLVVEDAYNMRRSMKSMLRHLGAANIIECEDGEAAWKILNSSEVDFIVCDWNMPRLPGLELLRRVRDSAEFRDIPFLMMTAEVSEARIVQAAETEVDGYIIKPFMAKTLEEKIQKILKNKEKPSEFDTHMKRGLNMMESAMYDTAAEEFEEALNLRPDSARARQALGEVYMKKGDMREAERWLAEAARANPQYIRVYESLAQLCSETGREDSALDFLERACEISPNNAQRQLKLGKLYKRMGEDEKADNAFQLALQNDRLNADLHTEIGEIYLDGGDSTKAAAAFKSSLNILENVHVYNRLGIALRKKGRYKDAIKEYNKALKLAPDDEVLHYNIGRAYMENGDRSQALGALRQALKLDPEFKECKDLIDQIMETERQSAGK